MKDFLCFSGPGVGGSAPASHTELYIVALGRSWGKPLVWSRRNRIYDPLPSSRTYRRPSKPMRRPIRRPAIYALACDPRKSGAGKRNAKIIRCFCKLILDRFWTIFHDFLLRSGSKNIVKYIVFVLFVLKLRKYQCFLLGTGTTTVKTVVFATRGKKHRKYHGFGFPRCKKHQYLLCFFCSEACKNMRRHRLFDDL